MSPRFALSAVLLCLFGLANTAGAQSVAPVRDPEHVLVVGHPRAAMLTVFDGAAQTFPTLGTTATHPMPTAPTDGVVVLAADHEMLFASLTAGWTRAAIDVWRLDEGERHHLGGDVAEAVAFGPHKKIGRLAVPVRLPPGLHHLEVELSSGARPVGGPDWTEDSSVSPLWILVASDPAAQGRSRVAAHPVVHLGDHRGVGTAAVAKALQFPDGDGVSVTMTAGQPALLRSDAEIWWADGGAGEGRAALELTVQPTAASPARTAPMVWHDVFETGPQTGPSRASHSLEVRPRIESPGTYKAVVRLTSRVRAGDMVDETSDTVQFMLHVRGDPGTGAIAGSVGADWPANTLVEPGGNSDEPVGNSDEPGGNPAEPVGNPAEPVNVTVPPIFPLPGVVIQAVNDSGVAATTRSDRSGRYVLSGLEPGSYLVRAIPKDLNYLPEWYDDQPSRRTATPVRVGPGVTTGGIDFALTAGGAIQGRVVDPTGAPIAGIQVTVGLWPSATDPGRPPGSNAAGLHRATTNDDGRYRIERLPGGAYWVQAADPKGRYLTEYFDGARHMTEASPVRVAPRHTAQPIDFELTSAGAVAGSVVTADPAGVVAPLSGIVVEARHPENHDQSLGRALTDRSGAYRVGGLEPGRMLMVASDSQNRYLTEWYEDATSPGTADPVPVEPGQTTDGINFSLDTGEREALVSLQPEFLGLVPGGTGRLAVRAHFVENLGAFETALEWDPNVFRVEDVELGDFLGSTGRRTIPVEPSIDNEAGTLRYAAASLGDQRGPTGGGVLFWIKLTALARGDTRVAFGDSLVADPAGARIEHGTRAGQVTVGACMRGDFDCNCVIDIRDVMAVVVRWGAAEGDPNYDPLYDLNGNGAIDIVDVQIEASLWGMQCDDPANRRGSASVQALDSGAALWLAAEPDGNGMLAVTIAADGVHDLAGFELDLDLPVGASLESMTLSPRLADSGRTFVALGPDQTGQSVRFGAYSMPGSAGPSGKVALADARVALSGAGELSVGAAWLVDSTGEAVRATGTALPVGGATGQVLLPFVSAGSGH